MQWERPLQRWNDEAGRQCSGEDTCLPVLLTTMKDTSTGSSMAREITTAKELALALVQGLVHQCLAGQASIHTVRAAALDAARLGASTDEIYRALVRLEQIAA